MKDRPSRPSLLRSLWLGVRRRCPRCGEDGLFRGWFTLKERCGMCDLCFEVHPGDTWGFWVVGDRLFVGLLVLGIYLGYMPVTLAGRIGLLVGMIAVVIATMPHRQGLCTALDYQIRERCEDSSASGS